MPNIIQINATCNWGSTGRIAEQIAQLAITKGWNCYIVHGARYVNKTNQTAIQVGSRLDNIVHALKSKLFGGHGLGSKRSTEYLVAKLKEVHPDIVHLHNIHGYYINYPVLFNYLSKANIPVVWTLHDCWSMTGHCTHFDSMGCDRWKTGCYDCPQKKAQYGTILLNRAKRNYKLKKECFTSVNNLTVVTVSKWLGSIVQESYLKGSNIRVINNGIDLNVFRPVTTDLKRRLNIPEEKKILLGVASDWGVEKGLYEFVKISEDPRYQVVIIGLTDEQVKALPSSIIAIQRTSNQQELVEYYSIADMLVNPTYNDSFPTVNIEALACGTPVVTYRTGGSPEILSSETGIVVERGDYDALVGAIETCSKNGKSFYSEACIKRAHVNYNKDERFMDYIKLYEELLSKMKS